MCSYLHDSSSVHSRVLSQTRDKATALASPAGFSLFSLQAKDPSPSLSSTVGAPLPTGIRAVGHLRPGHVFLLLG